MLQTQLIILHIMLCYIILYYTMFILFMWTCFNQLRGYPQGMRRRNNRITIPNLIFGQNEISVLFYEYIKIFGVNPVVLISNMNHLTQPCFIKIKIV
jgi:hypothetical protein